MLHNHILCLRISQGMNCLCNWLTSPFVKLHDMQHREKLRLHRQRRAEYEQAQLVDMYGKPLYPMLAAKYDGVFVPQVCEYK